jgi:hypothetical protein
VALYSPTIPATKRFCRLELLDRLAHLVTPPRLHKHWYCGLLVPNAKLRRAVTATAGPAVAMIAACLIPWPVLISGLILPALLCVQIWRDAANA